MKKFLILLSCVGLAWVAAAQVAPKMTVVRQVDADANGKTTPGDTLRYTITFTNTSATNLLNVVFTNASFPNQTLVPGSIRTSPVARPDATNAIGNTLLTVAAPGVLANDSDPDGDAVSVSGFSATSANGGTVSVAANGSFTYLSAAGFTGADTFTYTISDGNGGASTTTVTVTVANKVWYVNNAGANGDGRQTSPFNSLTGAAAASGVNDLIYVFQGSGNYTAGITLKNAQQLIGSGDALVVSGTTIYAAGTRPTILATSGTGVTLATDNIVHGVNIGSSSGRALSGAAVGNLVISNVIATATGGAAVNLVTGTVNVSLDSASSTGSADNGVSLSSINGTFVANGGSIGTAVGTDFVVAGGNGTVTYAGSINNTAGRSVDISGRSGGTLTLSGNITDTGTGILVQNNTGGTTTFSGTTKTLNTGANPAVTLTSNTGHTINFSNGGLAITTTSGAGFNATGGATAVNVTGTGNTISSGTGKALNVASTTIGASGLTFRSLSANGAVNGVTLSSTGSGGLTVTGDGGVSNNGSGGTISSATAQGIFISGSGPISLGYMIVQNSVTHGIQVTNATGFTLQRCNVTDVTGLATDEGVLLNNISGTVVFGNNTISGAPHNGVYLNNFNVNLSAFVMTNTTVTCPGGAACVTGGTTGNDGVLVVMRGNSVLTSGLISNCIVSGMRAVALQIQANDTGRIGANSGGAIIVPAAANSFVVQNNTLTGNGLGVDIGSSQVSSVTFQVLCNTVVGKVTSPGAIPNQTSSHAINAFTAAGSDTGPASHTFVGGH